MSLQISYIICLANTTNKANIICWLLIQYKYIICNVLVTELYEIIYRFDIEAVIKVILKKMLRSIIPQI